MVAAVRRGLSVRAVARRFNFSPPTVRRWVDRAKKLRLDRADFADKPSAPRTVANRTDEDMERKVLLPRLHLIKESDLGQFRAETIHLYLTGQSLKSVPAVRTINPILQRRGALDSPRRVRYPPPHKGWYIAELAQKKSEMDEFDFVEGLVIAGAGEVEIFNTVSLHSGIVGSWPARSWNAKSALEATLIHWPRHGLPTYAQYDNDTRFQAPHQHPGTIGRIILMCLGLGVTPVFAPPRESRFQAAIENYNGRWQKSVRLRFKQASVEELTRRSDKADRINMWKPL